MAQRCGRFQWQKLASLLSSGPTTFLSQPRTQHNPCCLGSGQVMRQEPQFKYVTLGRRWQCLAPVYLPLRTLYQIRYQFSRAQSLVNLTYVRGNITQNFRLSGPRAGVVSGPLRIITFSTSITQTYSHYNIHGHYTIVNCAVLFGFVFDGRSL